MRRTWRVIAYYHMNDIGVRRNLRYEYEQTSWDGVLACVRWLHEARSARVSHVETRLVGDWMAMTR